MHSKLRNGGAKGRASRLSSTTATASPSTPTTTSTSGGGGSGSGTSNANGTNSATAGLPTLAPSANALNNIANMAKQAQLESKRKLSSDDPGSNSNDGMSGSGSSGGVSTVVNPVTGLNVQILPKKCKTTSPCAVSPVLLECPEQFCSKKYKHANGLRYHQSHAHGGGGGGGDDDSMQDGQTGSDAMNEGNRSSSPVKEEKMVATGEKKTALPPATPMDTMDSSNSSSLNLTTATTNTGMLRFGQSPGPAATTEEGDEATMDSQKGEGGSFKQQQQQKKGRKSPVSGSESQLMGALGGGGEAVQSNRSEDVKSPAYSDISDDSTPVAESDANRKWNFDSEISFLFN